MQVSTSGDALGKNELLFQPALENISKNGATNKLMQSCSICKLEIEGGEFFKHLAIAHNDSKEKSPATPEPINSTVPESPKNESNTLATAASPKPINCQLDKPYKCKVCSKGFRLPCRLVSHEITHTGAKPFQCKVCQQRFTQSNSLNRHSRIHTIGQARVTCPYCRKPINSSSITVHIKTVHKKDPPEIATLIKPKSTKNSQKSKNLASEIKQDHKSSSDDNPSESKVKLVKKKRPRQMKNRKRISCDKCGQIFHHLRNLERHMASACEKTELTFVKEKTQPKTLNLEEKIQAFNIKPCKINLTKENILINCDAKLMQKITSVKENSTIQEKVTRQKSKAKTLPSNNQLTSELNHEVNQGSTRQSKSESHRKLHKCSFSGCQKSFTWAKHLENHYRVHTGDKPFQCKVCLKRFNQLPNLTTHSRRIHKSKLFKCKTCFKQFTGPASLALHARWNHRKRSSKASVRRFREPKENKNVSDNSSSRKQISSERQEKISGIKSSKGKAHQDKMMQTQPLTEATHPLKNPEGTVFACLECSKRDKNFSDLELHMKKAHGLELGANFDKSLLLRKISN